jgi:hypothetical protein
LRQQEIRDCNPAKAITVVASGPHILNPGPPSSVENIGTWIPATNIPKLSDDVARSMRKRGELPIDIVLGERVVIPSSSSSGGESSPGAEASSGGGASLSEEDTVPDNNWDGSWGALGGMKMITAESGRTWEADYVFYATGNKPNVGLVETVDASAIKGDLISVDEHLKVSRVRELRMRYRWHFS